MSDIDLIAEIAQAHEGSLGMAHAYIDALANVGVTAAKFQVHIAEAESSVFEPFRVNFSVEDSSRFEYWKRMEFTCEQWYGLKNHCESRGIEFLASPFSISAVELLETLGVRRYKVGSGEVSNLLLLEYIAKTRKPIILSSGLSTLEDLDQTVNFLKPFGNTLSILQCTTSYPTKSEDVGLNVIPEIKHRYRVPTGLSDHSGTIYPCLAAATLGAEILEFHVVFDRRMFGPDASSSLELDEVHALVNGVRSIQKSLGSPLDKTKLTVEPSLKVMFGKSLCVRRDLPAGHILNISDLETKKPGNRGISADRYREVIGVSLVRALNKWDFLNESDLLI